jgi:hypothetical protein
LLGSLQVEAARKEQRAKQDDGLEVQQNAGRSSGNQAQGTDPYTPDKFGFGPSKPRQLDEGRMIVLLFIHE